MKNKLLKRIMSLVLVVVMAVSTMAVSAVSASAETTNVTYSFEFQTAGGLGKSNNKISIKVNGDKGSTGWHDVGYVANARTDSASFDDIDVGNMKSITVKNGLHDGWYPEIITTSKINGNEKFTTHFDCGRWVDDKKEVTIPITDRGAKVTVKTSDTVLSGVDADVYVQLFDEEGKSSEKRNLTDLHPKANAFERGDLASFYIFVPENFGRVSKIALSVASIDGEWKLDYIDVTLDGEKQRFIDHKETSIYGIYFSWNDDYKEALLYPTEYIYKVTVKTSDKLYAGTDKYIDLLAYDSNNKYIRRCYLDNSENNFNRNDTDVFYIAATRKIDNIKMDKYTFFDDWHCDYVQLDQLDISKGKETVVESVKYNYNKWNTGSDKQSPTSKEVLK